MVDLSRYLSTGTSGSLVIVHPKETEEVRLRTDPYFSSRMCTGVFLLILVRKTSGSF